MVPPQLNSRLGVINPGLILTMDFDQESLPPNLKHLLDTMVQYGILIN